MTIKTSDPLRSPTLRRSLIEAACFALMVGLGETFFIAAAVRVGASAFQLGIVVGLPLAAGGLGAMGSVLLLRRFGARKPVVLGAVGIQIAALIAIAWSALSGVLDAALLIALVCLYQSCAMVAGTAWNSWFADLVPAEIRGRYFATRQRTVAFATCLGLLGGGLSLQWLEGGSQAVDGPLRGFALLFTLAAVARIGSFALLLRSDEPRHATLAGFARLRSFTRTEVGHTALRLVLLGAALQFVTYLASPFFVPFMLQGLGFSYLEYTTATLAVVIAKMALLPRWGRLVDEFEPRRAYPLAAVFVAVVPLPWLWANGLGWVLLAQMMSGFAWASYEVSFLTLLLDSTKRRTRPHMFAMHTLANGTAQFAGALLGGMALAAASGNFRFVFGLSMVLRLIVVLSIRAAAPGLRLEPRARRTLALRLVGFRVHGGFSVRPVTSEAGEDETPSRPRTPSEDAGLG